MARSPVTCSDRWYAKNPGYTKTPQYKASRRAIGIRYRAKYPEKVKARSALAIIRCQTDIVYWAQRKIPFLRNRCKRKGLEFNLTKEDLLAAIRPDKLCPVFLIPLVFYQKENRHNATTDRINPTKGYIRGNITIMSARANAMKADCVDPAAFRRLADYLEGLQCGCN